MKHISTTDDPNDVQESTFTDDDFVLGEQLESNGKGSVYKAVYKGQNIVLKMSRLDGCRLFRRKMEVENYKFLKELQGVSIPKLICYGYHSNGLFYVGLTDLQGEEPPTLSGMSTEHKAALRNVVNQLHDKNVAHRSIKSRNIIIDRNDKLWLIDFDNSWIKTDFEYWKKYDLESLPCERY